jgi:hypothetical protein
MNGLRNINEQGEAKNQNNSINLGCGAMKQVRALLQVVQIVEIRNLKPITEKFEHFFILL